MCQQQDGVYESGAGWRLDVSVAGWGLYVSGAEWRLYVSAAGWGLDVSAPPLSVTGSVTQTISDRPIKKTKCLPTFFKQTETELTTETPCSIFEILNTKQWTGSNVIN